MKTGDQIVAIVDSRVRIVTKLPRSLESDLKSSFSHQNPDYYKKKSMGFYVGTTPSVIKTFQKEEDRLLLPRGRGISELRRVASEYGFRVKFLNRMTEAPVEWPPFLDTIQPRWYQEEIATACIGKIQGVIRAPTGSGKSLASLLFLSRLGQRAIVIVKDQNLLDQWKENAIKYLGLSESDIGLIRSGRKYRSAKIINLAMQQTLYARGDAMQRLMQDEPFGAVVVDEAQTIASNTFQKVVDEIPCKYRIAVSADETRRDKKEFITYDSVGPVIYEVSRDQLEQEAVVQPVTIRVVLTEFDSDWYEHASSGDKDFKRLIDEMISDEDRNELLLSLVENIVKNKEIPGLIFTHRREHAFDIADKKLSVERRIKCGIFVGGSSDKQRFIEDKAKMERGSIDVAIGTFNAIGVGFDLPKVQAGIVATPISRQNRQFFNQVRGRVARTARGKQQAIIYYPIDPCFISHIKTLWEWNNGKVEYEANGSWVQATDPMEVIRRFRSLRR